MDKETVENVNQDVTGPTVKEEDDMEEKHTGHLQNVREINRTMFTFDLQAKSSAKRFICLFPESKSKVQ